MVQTLHKNPNFLLSLDPAFYNITEKSIYSETLTPSRAALKLTNAYLPKQLQDL